MTRFHDWLPWGSWKTGDHSDYAQFRARLTRARAEGELNLVRKLEDDPDWRAAAFRAWLSRTLG